ncbi:hypothetical protein NQ318_001800 [Aromia moschata]|uniref:Uncharacterized protein n=1 Tax=Aromia moschata TaxID=1265417 RepID=A0AAV8XSG0_9CUCU|nr:hypothetical protein NQ318_001800 [Aromia moschata]
MNFSKFLINKAGIPASRNRVGLSVLGKVDIRQQRDSAYRENIRRHNENVNENRHFKPNN